MYPFAYTRRRAPLFSFHPPVAHTHSLLLLNLHYSIILRRPDHVTFLTPKFADLDYSSTALDASRSWIMYWVLGSLSMLDVQINPEERDRAIQTILSFQHPDGGFGGGPGHLAHLAATYASVCCLAMLLEEVDQELVKETWARVDIKKLYDWMVSLKVPGGGFAVQRDGEVDVRGIFGALAVATMLNLLTPELIKDLPEYLVSCQTHEGGMTSNMIHYPANRANLAFPSKRVGAAIGEAHGGYTSCALASYFFLQGIPNRTISAYKLDHEACLRWAVQAQALPIEGGGFRGRTNKLVDGCYAWWCGGLFPLLEAIIISELNHSKLPDLYDRQALQEYILLASQDQPPTDNAGGLRDKPEMSPDLYHTHYVLAGLSLAQHSPSYSPAKTKQLTDTFKPPELSKVIFGKDGENENQLVERMKGVYSRILGWEFNTDRQIIVGVPSNRVVRLTLFHHRLNTWLINQP